MELVTTNISQPEKRKPGRPRKDKAALTETGEHWVDMLKRLYSEGATDVEVCKALRMSHRKFLQKERNDPLFAELVEFGRLSSKAWWVELGRKCARSGAPSQAFNYWWANMKNQFGWTDKAEVVDTKSTDSLSNDEIKARIAELTNKIKKVPNAVEMAQLLEGNE